VIEVTLVDVTMTVATAALVSCWRRVGSTVGLTGHSNFVSAGDLGRNRLRLVHRGGDCDNLGRLLNLRAGRVDR